LKIACANGRQSCVTGCGIVLHHPFGLALALKTAVQATEDTEKSGDVRSLLAHPKVILKTVATA
jgi:hypothetical protein